LFWGLPGCPGTRRHEASPQQPGLGGQARQQVPPDVPGRPPVRRPGPRRVHLGEPTTASGHGQAITGIAADTLAINPLSSTPTAYARLVTIHRR
jgi:hypothetical protein